jgi:hypothetical protein
MNFQKIFFISIFFLLNESLLAKANIRVGCFLNVNPYIDEIKKEDPCFLFVEKKGRRFKFLRDRKTDQGRAIRFDDFLHLTWADKFTKRLILNLLARLSIVIPVIKKAPLNRENRVFSNQNTLCSAFFIMGTDLLNQMINRDPLMSFCGTNVKSFAENSVHFKLNRDLFELLSKWSRGDFSRWQAVTTNDSVTLEQLIEVQDLTSTVSKKRKEVYETKFLISSFLLGAYEGLSYHDRKRRFRQNSFMTFPVSTNTYKAIYSQSIPEELPFDDSVLN